MTHHRRRQPLAPAIEALESRWLRHQGGNAITGLLEHPWVLPIHVGRRPAPHGRDEFRSHHPLTGNGHGAAKPDGHVTSSPVPGDPGRGLPASTRTSLPHATPAPHVHATSTHSLTAGDIAVHGVPRLSSGYAIQALDDVYVPPPNRAPMAVGGVFLTPHGHALTEKVYGSDPDRDALTFIIVQPPENGSLTLNNSGIFTYTPRKVSGQDFTGVDTFTFKVNDGKLDSNVSSVAIKVTDAAPVAADQSLTMNQDRTLGGTVTATDADGDPLTYRVLTQTGKGTLTLAATGQFTYTPPPGFTGTESFTYRANDGFKDSNTATVSIRTLVNQFPKVVATSTTVTWVDPYVAIPQLSGENSVAASLSATSLDGVHFNGPPTFTPSISDRLLSDRQIVSPGTPVAFYQQNSAGVMIQGYQSIIDVKWTMSKAKTLDALGVPFAGAIDSLFGSLISIELETKLTLTILADGSTPETPPVNTTNSDKMSAKVSSQ